MWLKFNERWRNSFLSFCIYLQTGIHIYHWARGHPNTFKMTQKHHQVKFYSLTFVITLAYRVLLYIWLVYMTSEWPQFSCPPIMINYIPLHRINVYILSIFLMNQQISITCLYNWQNFMTMFCEFHHLTKIPLLKINTFGEWQHFLVFC